ncbi:hypothetical protein GCM10020358_27630 [Amorphoplanes nipponensis]
MPTLAHPAAEPLAEHPGLRDAFRAADDQRADRRAQPLGQAADRVSKSAPYSANGTASATWACQIRAPSQCSATPAVSAASRSARRRGQAGHAAAAEVWVCSTAIARVGTDG